MPPAGIIKSRYEIRPSRDLKSVLLPCWDLLGERHHEVRSKSSCDTSEGVDPVARAAIDGRTTRHAGHNLSLRIRARIEESFGWTKTIAGGRKLRDIGRDRNRAWFKMVTSTYNVIRIAALDTATT